MGISAEAVMQLLREAMASFLVPDLVSRTIFDALGEYGGNLPHRGTELKRFVEGPLVRALMRRMDERTREAVLASLRPILDDIIASELPPASDAALAAVAIPPTPAAVQDDLPTAPRLASSQPYVLVVASERAMEQRLRLAVGSGLGTSTARTLVDVQAGLLARSPRLVLVDCTDPPPIADAELSRMLSRARPDSLVIVWGATRPFGRGLLASMRGPTLLPVGLEEAEGVEPLLDLVRSHGMPEVDRAAPAPPSGLDRTFRRPEDGRVATSRPTPRYGTLTPPRRGPGPGSRE